MVFHTFGHYAISLIKLRICKYNSVSIQKFAICKISNQIAGTEKPRISRVIVLITPKIILNTLKETNALTSLEPLIAIELH